MFFTEEEKVGINSIKELCDRMRTEIIQRAIMIIREKMTIQAKTTLQELELKFKIEPFFEQELIVNITKHVLVPKHEVLSEEDKQSLLTQYKLRESQLPRIQVTKISLIK